MVDMELGALEIELLLYCNQHRAWGDAAGCISSRDLAISPSH